MKPNHRWTGPRDSCYEESVFINAPFDNEYQPLFHAIIFTIFDCGFVSRCAMEIEDSGDVRIAKLFELINNCKYGIHDLSRTEINVTSKLPRFNMPLELGIFLGAKYYGTRPKIALILDKEKYRYHEFCSDIAGQDIRAHNAQIDNVIRQIRNWLSNTPEAQGSILPGGEKIIERYKKFQKQLPGILREVSVNFDELQYKDYALIVSIWLRKHSNYKWQHVTA